MKTKTDIHERSKIFMFMRKINNQKIYSFTASWYVMNIKKVQNTTHMHNIRQNKKYSKQTQHIPQQSYITTII